MTQITLQPRDRGLVSRAFASIGECVRLIFLEVWRRFTGLKYVRSLRSRQSAVPSVEGTSIRRARVRDVALGYPVVRLRKEDHDLPCPYEEHRVAFVLLPGKGKGLVCPECAHGFRVEVVTEKILRITVTPRTEWIRCPWCFHRNEISWGGGSICGNEQCQGAFHISFAKCDEI